MKVYMTVCRDGILVSKHEILVLFPEGIKAETCSRSLDFISTQFNPPIHTYLRAAEFKKKKLCTIRTKLGKERFTAVYSGEY
jgi:hypothetical protein